MRHFEFPSRFVTVQKWLRGDWPMQPPDYSACSVNRYLSHSRFYVGIQVSTSTTVKHKSDICLAGHPLTSSILESAGYKVPPVRKLLDHRQLQTPPPNASPHTAVASNSPVQR